MSDEKTLSTLVLKAIVDKEFRHALIRDVEGVIAREGYVLSEEEKKVIKDLRVQDWDAITVDELDKRLREINEQGRIEVEGTRWTIK
jgi:hypothetical protein